jgi:hypothetical protein
VVRGYVAAAQGVELESCLGQQVSLQGAVKTLPGGDMPYMTCQRVLSGTAEMPNAHVPHSSAPVRRESFVPVVQDQRPREIAVQSDLPSRSDMAADPAPRAAALPLREVVLEPQTLAAGDDSQDRRSLPSERRTDQRHLRRSGVQSTNYEETLPTPAPAGEVRRSPIVGDPALEPTPMEQGTMVSEGPAVGRGRSYGHVGCDACDEGSCNACYDDACADPCWGPGRPLFCWGPTGIWVKADYMLWWERGTHVPPLVTTGPSVSQPGIIGENGTTVLFGDDYINNKSESGGRIQAGMWLNRCSTFGFEGEYFALGDEGTDYYIWSDGNPIISRPFFDNNPAHDHEAVENVAVPRGNANSLDGAINISATTRFHGAGAHFLFTTCRQEGCWTDECGSCTTYRDRFRADLVAGYRYLDLEDQLGITETLTTTSPTPVDPNNPTGTQGVAAFLVQDQFHTQNSFNGADLGMKFEFQRNRWSLDMFPRVALGSTHSVVDINGSTRTTSPAGVESTVVGGLLTQPSNIGHYEANNFAVVPDLDLKVGFQFTSHTRLVVGYDVLYWSSVARAGEQIDRTVNSSYLPNAPGTPSGEARPLFALQQTGFWAQGINVGVDCRW